MNKKTEYLYDCPACQEALELGLTWEETHSTRIPGYLETENGLIESPHNIRR